MAKWLVLRFKKDTELNLGDLQTAIRIVQYLADAEPINLYFRAEFLALVSKWLHMYYECDNDLPTLDSAINACHHALCLQLQCDNLHSSICAELGKMLLMRGMKIENMAEFYDVIVPLETSLEKPSLDQYIRALVLNSLSVSSVYSSQWSGKYEDLDRAIDYIVARMRTES